MTNTFSVAIHYNDVLGYIEYDEDTHTAVVSLPDEKGKKLAEEYLASKHQIRVPHETLNDFTEQTIDPLADVRSLQIALTRILEETEVYIDWSRPVEFVKKYPTLDSLPKGGVKFELAE